MISILIPVYNYNVTQLVNDLHQQATDAYVEFEIIVMEDGSTLFTDENRMISELNFCRYIPLKKNIGRSAIRNKLADEAKYDHLLFLDCDSGLYNQYYIQKYLTFCHEDCVVLGGRVYEKNVEPAYSLLHTYGKERERNDLENLKKRKKHPLFTSPNFLISKSIFNQIRFDESIKGYGHEDTLFGIMLQRKGIEFKYIDNPVVHIGIEDNETFICKTEKALENLFSLYQSGKYPELVKESPILSFYEKIKWFRLRGLCRLFYRLFYKPIRKNLLSASPSLFLFDVYKLGVLCGLSKTK